MRLVLRRLESLRCLLAVELPAPDVPSRKHRPAAIAVVTCRGTAHTELGSLLVLSDSSTKAADVLPVTEHLALEVVQTTLPHLSAATESSSAWRLCIKRDAHDTSPLICVVRAREIQNLTRFTAECRRLKEIAATTHPTDTDFNWAEAHRLDLSTRRPDLRIRRQPLHARLSPAIAGLPEDDDVSDIAIIQRDWIEQVATKEASTGNRRHLKVRLGTFNVNGKTPSQDLYTWLRSSEPPSQSKSGWISPLKLSPFEVPSDPLYQEPRENNLLTDTIDERAFGEPDMLVLGFQELDLSTEALLYATSTVKEDAWLAAIFAGLGEKHVLYEKLTSRQLVGMLLIVVVKKSLVPCFTDVRSCDAGSGIMGFMGNKGATAIRLEFTPGDPRIVTCRSTVLTFVNAHLAAFDEMVERRNYDFRELSERLAFFPHERNESYPQTLFVDDTYNIYQSDALFWMGGKDLNYRLDLPDEDIRNLLFSYTASIDSIQTLLLYDQLKAAIRSNDAFVGFTEHHITYAPTYRLALGVSKDRLGYDTKRKPAWTDRILYMASPDLRVTQVAYRSHSEITMSDHKPVSADFDISLALIDESQYENVSSTLERELAGQEDSDQTLRVKVQPHSIQFGAVTYKKALHREVVIENEGDVPCVFRFVGTDTESEHISPSWLRIEPVVGFLRPNETKTILLSVFIDNNSAAKLNLGSPTLECTLILHTALGKDHFLTVSGDYQYTCFANTLERLTRLAGPIRRLKSPVEMTPAEQAVSSPREFTRLINWMMAHVSATDVLFDGPAAQERLCHVIRECLDTGDEFPSQGPDGDHQALVTAFASTLVSFLDSLIEPVVPARLHAECLRARDKDEAFQALGALPNESINVWISLMAFLHYIAKQGDTDLPAPRKPDILAGVFAPVLLRDDSTGVHPRVSPIGKRDFLLFFID